MNKRKYILLLCSIGIIVIVLILQIPIKTSNKDFIEDSPVSNPIINTINKSILLKEPKTIKVTYNTPEPIKPYISAESYIVGNLKTGDTYISHNSERVFPIASVSKLLTALIARHVILPQAKIKFTQSMLDAYGDSGYFTLGETFTPEELMYALVLESSNDAALAFAESYGLEKFVAQMNGFAKEIGMSQTSFNDPTGLSPENISNAKDLFTLAKYLYRAEKPLLEITRQKEYDLSTTSEHNAHHFVNINPYSYYKDFIGGKTGRTKEAKESMISLFNHTIDTTEYSIAVIVLRSNFAEREIDTEKLLGMFIDKIAKSR